MSSQAFSTPIYAPARHTMMPIGFMPSPPTTTTRITNNDMMTMSQPTTAPKMSRSDSQSSAVSDCSIASISSSSNNNSYYASWTFGSAMRKSSISGGAPSAYISDEDLFGCDGLAPDSYLREAPAPPRGAEAWLAAQPVQQMPVQQLPVYQPRAMRCSIPSSKRRTSSAAKRKT